MKKLLIGFLIGVTVLGVGCGNNLVDKSADDKVEVSETEVDKKREEFLEKAFNIVKIDVDKFNKKEVNDKISIKREDNIIIYTQNKDLGNTVSELNEQCKPHGEDGVKIMEEYAKGIRQSAVDGVSYYYDEIVKQLGEDYEFYIKSEKVQDDELVIITKYGKDGYEFEYDLFEELGY